MRERLLTAAVCAGLSGLGVAAALVAWPLKAGELLEAYNFPHALSRLERTAEQATDAGQQMAADLQALDKLVSHSDQVKERMNELEGALSRQRASLGALSRSVERQLQLSAELQALAESLPDHMAGFAAVAKAQTKALRRVGDVSHGMEAELARVVAANQRMAGKLRSARDLSVLIGESIP